MVCNEGTKEDLLEVEAEKLQNLASELKIDAANRASTLTHDLPAWIVPLSVKAVKSLQAMTALMMMNGDMIAVWIHHILGWNRPKI
eukprot:9318278-Ditylum_brightwellii.AAC.1